MRTYVEIPQWMIEAAKTIHRDWIADSEEYYATGQQLEEDIDVIALEMYYHLYQPFAPNDVSVPESCICGPGLFHRKQDCPEWKFGHDMYAYYGKTVGRLKRKEDCRYCKEKGHDCYEPMHNM